jgi:hypothetical protein
MSVEVEPPVSNETAGHASPHAGEEMLGPHGVAEDHGEDIGHDDPAHGGEALGPIDVRMWGAAGVGILLGLVVVVALLMSVGWLGAA